MKRNILSVVRILAFSSLIFSMGACQQKAKDAGTTENAGDSKANAPAGGKVSVDEFDKLISQNQDAQVLDVRTDGEYTGGHLKNALNIEVNAKDFDAQAEKSLNKTKPVFVYCLSGGRSSAAAEELKKIGYTTVYEMDGGLMKWQAANKTLETGTASANEGLSVADLEKKVQGDKYVLVDYSAVWCGPCKQLAPIVDKIVKERSDKVSLMKVDADKNKELCQAKGIDGIPYLELYNKGKLVWKHVGYIDEQQLLAETKL